MTEAEFARDGILWFGAHAARLTADAFRASHRLLLGIDGFMGSGKSPFATVLEAELGRACIRLDALLVEPDVGDRRLYVDRLQLDRLQESVAEAAATHAPLIVDGILLQQVFDRLLPRESAFLVYVAAVWRPRDGLIVWNEGARLEMTELSEHPLHAELERYHRERHPHVTADLIIARDVDRYAIDKLLVSPDGQEFSIPHNVLREADVEAWRPTRGAYASDDEAATLAPLGLIVPPQLLRGVRQLDERCLADVLGAIRMGVALPPVVVVQEPRSAKATLLDGTHRFFASVALGFTLIPVIHVDRGRAELLDRHRQ